MNARSAHRWLGIIVGLQLVAWIVGGFYFSFVPIEEVRGGQFVQTPEPVAIEGPTLIPEPLAQGQCSEARLRTDLPRSPGGVFWVLECGERTRVFDAVTAREQAHLDAGGATAIAAGLTGLQPLGARLLESIPDGAEFRGAPLPIWQVRLEHPESPRLYLTPGTGRVIAVRTDTWRLFDLLWGLHIMDWDDREDFNHLLLQVAALLALASVGTGLWLAVSHYRRAWRRRRTALSQACGTAE